MESDGAQKRVGKLPVMAKRLMERGGITVEPPVDVVSDGGIIEKLSMESEATTRLSRGRSIITS